MPATAGRLQSPVYSLAYVVISALIFYLLLQLNLIVGLLFFILALVSLPASIIHRREAHVAPEVGADSESHGKGVMRLVSIVGLDTSGIALGVLVVILLVLIARRMAYG